MHRTTRLLILLCLLVGLLWLCSCRGVFPFAPRPRSGGAAVGNLDPLSRLREQLPPDRAQAWLVAAGKATGDVFRLEVVNIGDNPLRVLWNGTAVVTWLKRFQSYLLLTSVELRAAPGEKASCPLTGFCLKPGWSIIPEGTRIPFADAFQDDRTEEFPVEDGVVRGATKSFPVIVAGEGGIPGSQLAPGARGKVYVGTANGRFRTHDPSLPWIPPADAPDGHVTVLGAGGQIINEFVLVRKPAATVRIPAIPVEEGTADPLTAEEAVQFTLAAEVAVVTGPGAAAAHASTLAGVAHAGTTVTQRTLWDLGAVCTPPPEGTAEPSADDTRDPEARQALAAVDAAAEEALEAADAQLRAEFGVDISIVILLDATKKLK